MQTNYNQDCTSPISGTTFFPHLNQIFSALDSMNSGNDFPTTNLADGKLFFKDSSDTTAGLYIRNNSSWVKFAEFVSGNLSVLYAEQLKTPITLKLTGDIAGTASIDGSSDVTIETSIQTYNQIKLIAENIVLNYHGLYFDTPGRERVSLPAGRYTITVTGGRGGQGGQGGQGGRGGQGGQGGQGGRGGVSASYHRQAGSRGRSGASGRATSFGSYLTTAGSVGTRGGAGGNIGLGRYSYDYYDYDYSNESGIRVYSAGSLGAFATTTTINARTTSIILTAKTTITAIIGAGGAAGAGGAGGGGGATGATGATGANGSVRINRTGDI